MPWFGRIFGTFFGVGFVPVVPATWTSLVVAALYYFVPAFGEVSVQAGFFLLTLVLGIPACSALERLYGEDPKQATVDEACGMAVAMLGVAPTLFNCLAAFFLFRVFDVLKPPPARQLERMHGGAGVMLDDVAAGVYTRLAMWLLAFVVGS